MSVRLAGSLYACRAVLAPCSAPARTRSRSRTERLSAWTTVVERTPTCSPTIRLMSCRGRSGTPSSGTHRFRFSIRKAADSRTGLRGWSLGATSHAARDIDAVHSVPATWSEDSLSTALGGVSEVAARLYHSVT